MHGGIPEMNRLASSVEARIIFACIILLIVPFVVPSPYVLNVAIMILIYLISDMGQNIVMGYSGQLSVAGAALMAMGAYTAAILVNKSIPFELAALIALAVSTLTGVLLGYLTFRVKTHYLLLITIGFHETVLVLINNWLNLTGGSNGMPINSVKLLGFISLGDQKSYYFFTLAVCMVFLYIAFKIRSSGLGLSMMSIRDHEKGALSIGINVVKYRVIAMGFSGLFAGMAGILLGFQTGFLAPTMFAMSKALLLILVVVLGGMGSNRGLIAASVFMTLVAQYLNQFANVSMLIYGLIIVIVLLFAPGGIESLLTAVGLKRKPRLADRKMN
jgi:branched-chain amino acid transport system permease protein